MNHKELEEKRKQGIEDIKKGISKSKHGKIYLKLEELKSEWEVKESNIDFYHKLRKCLFNQGVMVGVVFDQECISYLSFRIVNEYDIKPDDEEKICLERDLFYSELEKDILGLSEIAKMEEVNNLCPDDIVRVLRSVKEYIEKVRFISDDTIGVTIKTGI